MNGRFNYFSLYGSSNRIKLSFIILYIHLLFIYWISNFSLTKFYLYIIFWWQIDTFYSQVFLSLITPFIFLIILYNNTLYFIQKIIITIIEKICEYILNPLIRIAIYYIYVPIAEFIDYLYRHSSIISSFLHIIGNLLGRIIDFLWFKILFPFLRFFYCRILIPILVFILNYIMIPFYLRVIVPVYTFIRNNRVFNYLVSIIMSFYKTIYEFVSDAITFVGKICKIIIDAIEELMKETYNQVIAPFAQLVKRIFGE